MNQTVQAGETTIFNCSSVRDELIAYWIINGTQYYWTDFKTIRLFTFSLNNNSLIVNESPSSLDGTSFQCIINGIESVIGYLTVLTRDSIIKNSTTLSFHGPITSKVIDYIYFYYTVPVILFIIGKIKGLAWVG